MSEPLHNDSTSDADCGNVGECPDLETLAAFAEGKLESPARLEMVKHVARCERCRELIGEALRDADETTEEEESGDQPDNFVKGPWGLSYPYLAAAASLAVVGLATALWFSLRGSSGDLGTIALLPQGLELQERLGERWNVPIWSELRGDVVVATTPGLAVRLGVRRVDLFVAVRAQDHGQSIYGARQLRRFLESEDDTLPYSLLYDELLFQLQNKAPWDEIGAAVTEHDELLRDIEPQEYLEIGSWLEATRVAAIAATEDFADTDWLREADRWLEATDDDALLEQLRTISEAASTDRARTRDAAYEAIRLLASGEASLKSLG